MALIRYIEFEDATADLQQLYVRFGGAVKRPANIIRISGVNPSVMDQHVGLYRAIMYGESPLSRQQREMIAVVVSALNQCHY